MPKNLAAQLRKSDQSPAGEECARLYADEDMVIERLGRRVAVSLYRPLEIQEIHQALRQIPAEVYVYRQMFNRGQAPGEKDFHCLNTQGDSISPESTWTVREHDSSYLLKLDQGMSFGLFLDQRDNRRRIGELAEGKHLLNLFCYTGGFSIQALNCGALSTTNVDTSQRTLNWLLENAKINHIDPAKIQNKAMESSRFLTWAKKKGVAYDIIVCDPPSFSRGKAGVMKLEESWRQLLEQCADVLSHRGQLLFSCNLHKWSERDFARDLKSWSRERFEKTQALRPIQEIRSQGNASMNAMKSVLMSFKVD